MRRNRLIFRVLCCMLLCFVFTADSAKAEVNTTQKAKIQDIKKLMSLIRLEEVVMLAADNALERFFPILKKASAQTDSAASEVVFAILKSSTLSLVKRQVSARGGLMDRVVPLYDKHYSHAEIQSLIRFYETPLGKKVSTLRPEIVKEGMVVAEEWINFLEPLLVQALARSLKKEGYVIVKRPSD